MLWAIVNCVATKVSLREHRVNKAMLAICPKCVNQLNLGPKEEAPGLHVLVESYSQFKTSFFSKTT